MATPHATRDGATPLARARDRSTHVLAALATVVALWIGLTAPGVSPVSAAPLPGVTAPATNLQAPAGTGGVQFTAPLDRPGGGDGR